MAGDKVKIWITKYAITGGIKEAMAVIKKYQTDYYEEVADAGTDYRYDRYYRRKNGTNEYEHSLEAALAAADAMTKKRIESLKKQIAKLEKKKFKVIPITEEAK